ncbi:MAG: aldose 1-epimerase family protein [Cardiobacteriaceae bacterium]|nr:aldose 1-epimerase family protein [Cardiobacteriaceae bacterium]
MYRLPLPRHCFAEQPQILLQSDDFTITGKRYPHGIESLVIENRHGHLEILPYMGQILWNAVFDGHSLRMKNMFARPQPAGEIIDTYGCFSFHSGLLTGGCPAPEDSHPLHGEFPCAPMDSAWLEITADTIRVVSEYEYVRGFGHHYRARPSVRLAAHAKRFDIDMAVTNLATAAPMPLLYMCHMNYAYVADGVMRENLPSDVWQLRRTVPAHVHPTPAWQAFNDEILAGTVDGSVLNRPEAYDPEIVYFADDLPQYGDTLEFEIDNPANGVTFSTRFASRDFPCATRWILHNADQQVAAFVLPATARPEGYRAAEAAGTLQWLAPGASKHFSVNTGIKE